MLKFEYYFYGVVAIFISTFIGDVVGMLLGGSDVTLVCILLGMYMWFKDGFQGWLIRTGRVKENNQKGDLKNDQNK